MSDEFGDRMKQFWRPNYRVMKNSKELATCGNCDCQKMLHPLTIKRSQNKNNGQYICGSCKAKTAIKPQCSPAYWNEKKKSAKVKL